MMRRGVRAQGHAGVLRERGHGLSVAARLLTDVQRREERSEGINAPDGIKQLPIGEFCVPYRCQACVRRPKGLSQIDDAVDAFLGTGAPHACAILHRDLGRLQIAQQLRHKRFVRFGMVVLSVRLLRVAR